MYKSRINFVRLLFALFVVGVLSHSALADDAPRVRMIIDYGDGVEKHFTALAWRDGMTVFDAIEAARKHERGVTFRHLGAGARTLITQFDDQKNEGGGGRNWIFRVNDKLADRSVGVYNLNRNDVVLWRFEKYP